MRRHDESVFGFADPLRGIPDAALLSRRSWLAGICGGLGLALAPPATAASIGEPDTSRTARLDSVQRFPLQHLSARARQQVAPVLERPTLFRRMPVERIPCHPDVFVFLIRYPEVVVNMWELMGATKLKVKRIADYVLDADDGAGTQSRIELIYGTRQQHVILADGEYAGPLFRRRMTGRTVLLLTTQYAVDAAGDNVVTSTLDVFLTLDNIGADLVARTLHPMLGKTADHNFAESARFVSQVSEQAASNPAGMQRLVKKLTKVRSDVRTAFSQVIARVTAPEAQAEIGAAPPSSATTTAETQPAPIVSSRDFRR
jgi:hypothetical protein